MTSGVNAKPTNSTRKPLDAQFVGETNAAAIKALGDNAARRKWPDSKHGSPLTTNILCAEIARLNIAQEALLEMAKLFEKTAEYEIRRSEQEGDDEGARMKTLTLNLIRQAIALASPLPSADRRSV